MPGVHINRKERSVDIDATVCLDEGTLELVACTKDSKEHESIVAINASAMHVHTALLLLGAKSGKPAGQRTIGDDGNERWIDSPPSGGPVTVSLVINNETGAAVERPIHEFIIPSDAANPETEKFPTHSFLFAGSRVTATADGGRRYLCDQSGNVISITTFGDELLCPPRVESHENSALLWQVDNRHLPAPGTRVTLRLRPQL